MLVVTVTLEMGVGGQSHVSDVMLVVTVTLEMGVGGQNHVSYVEACGHRNT